jgi:hypothetical protein
MENNNLAPQSIQSMSDERPVANVYNSIDYIAHVNRLSVRRSYHGGIYHYGRDNNYPHKVIEIAKRSSTLDTARYTQAKFVAGLGFAGATSEDVKRGTDIKVNNEGLSGYDFLKHLALEKATINIAIHVNYNMLGEAVEFTPVQYEFVRKKVKEEHENFDKFIITNIWHLDDYQNALFGNEINFATKNFLKWVQERKMGYHFSGLECYAYNPDPIAVREQIAECGGIDKYSGQLFYKKYTNDIYQLAVFDSVLDDAQLEAEIKLFSLASIQNGYSIGGILKHPMSIDNHTEFQRLKEKIQSMKGSINAGRILTMPYSSAENMPTNVFESTQYANIDRLFPLQKEEAKNNINEKYNIPKPIIGRDNTGNFATQDMEEAYALYNSTTKPIRTELEIDLTTIFDNSILNIKLPIEIQPLTFEAIRKDIPQNTQNIPENDTIND